jgi:NRAMP (natural resistance-associated macrophage protein)-like metal ion transporter
VGRGRTEPHPVKRFFKSLGPGLITGVADDDPSGITTYSVAGAKHGVALLWTAWATWPMIAAVQLVCARVGMVTGRGLTSALREKFPRGVVLVVAVLLLLVNTLTVGADLAGMGDVANMITHVPALVWVVLFGVGIAAGSVQMKYVVFERVLKWLTLALFAYVIDGFYVGHDWGRILKATFLPSLNLHERQLLTTVVAVLGTTISPYLFFWQSSLEVEDEKARGRSTVKQREHMTDYAYWLRKRDVGVGSFFSNFVMFFIMLTTGVVLHEHGHTAITTSRQAAEALRPFAGSVAALLYALGLIGTGALAIPTMSGSAAYALAETFGWREGIDQRMSGARSFYIVLIASIVVGIGLNVAGLNPITGMYVAAVVNGLLAPIVLVGILLVAADRKVMHTQPAQPLAWWIVVVTTVVMTVAAVGMFVL